MSELDTIKKQRDQFLAFAFASADLFLEINSEGKITFVIGAAKGVTGSDSSEWAGKNWLDLFAKHDHALVESMLRRAKPGHRQGPFLFDLNEKISSQKGIITGIKMPGSDSFYITLGFSDAISTHIAELTTENQNKAILDVESFNLAAEEAALKAKAIGKNIKLSVFDFAPTDKDQKRIGDENWDKITENINELLLTSSIDGRTAGAISKGRYGIVQDDSIDTAVIKEKMEEFAKTQDPEGKGITVRSKSIDSNLKDIQERDIAKSLVYTIREFERKGADLTIDSLNSGFDQYMEANTEKIEELKSYIERSDFKVNFQPIVDFKTKQADHYELRCLFDHGNTQEWVMFGEDIGLVSGFDLAICDRAITYVNHKAANNRIKFSINISGKSFEDPDFFEKLKQLLDKNKSKGINNRLMFEITESLHIKDPKKVAHYIQILHDIGFKTALDDFEADEASLKLLKSLDVDSVKIDGKIISKILTSQSHLALMKNLIKSCNDNGKTIIAKSVEDQKQVDVLLEMGVKLGQGFLFGGLSNEPDYIPPTNF